MTLKNIGFIEFGTWFPNWIISWSIVFTYVYFIAPIVTQFIIKKISE